VSCPGFATGAYSCLNRIYREEGLPVLFLGLPAMLIRQIPYTTVQLAVFELLTSEIFSYLYIVGKYICIHNICILYLYIIYSYL
jgi:hypothetical protein